MSLELSKKKAFHEKVSLKLNALFKDCFKTCYGQFEAVFQVTEKINDRKQLYVKRTSVFILINFKLNILTVEKSLHIK